MTKAQKSRALHIAGLVVSVVSGTLAILVPKYPELVPLAIGAALFTQLQKVLEPAVPPEPIVRKPVPEIPSDEPTPRPPRV